MPSVQLFGKLVEKGVLHNATTSSTSISASVSATCDTTLHVHSSESQERIKKAIEDAVEATAGSKHEINRCIRILGTVDTEKTLVHGPDFGVRLEAAAYIASAAAKITKASSDAALHVKQMMVAAVNSSHAVSVNQINTNRIETSSADVTRENNLNLTCKEVSSAAKDLSDALAVLSESVQSGPNDSREEMGVTSEMLVDPTNATEVGITSKDVPSNSQTYNINVVSVAEDDASRVNQAELDTPDLEVDHGTEPRGKDVLKDGGNLQSELEFLRPCDARDDKSLPETSSLPTNCKRKLSSPVKDDEHRKRKSVSDTPELRRSSRKIQPTSKVLEAWETFWPLEEAVEPKAGASLTRKLGGK